MKISYAPRRAAFYPYDGGTGWEVPPKEVRQAYLRAVHDRGFAGIEIGLGQGVGTSEAEIRALCEDLEAAGVPCAAVRGGGGFAHPGVAAHNRQRVADAIRMAAWIGAPLVNMTVLTPPTDPHGIGAQGTGERLCQGGSRTATEADFAITARYLQEAAALAADLGVAIAIEMHQRSIADTAWSCLHLLERIDRPNVGINPDLGNLYWAYDEPEEPLEACIAALAPHANYWHCKSLARTYIPEHHRAYFRRVPLPEGEIDYRFAIAAMAQTGYDGALAIEGVPLGDQLYNDARSLAYCQQIIRELDAAQ
ncbi:MAG: sugar phosphate isomerase/epimerase [Chloroflexota bacterium]|nr:sugar phosphate isomerase/epimerase [Chloroflexota bacterium]